MTITKRVSKNGDISFRIKVSMGYSSDGKQIIESMTYKPDSSLSPKQAEKEAYKQGIIFEERCKINSLATRRIKFEELAKEYLELLETTKKIKTSSLVRLKGLQERTYNSIGHIYIDKLNKRQIQSFIISLSKNGVNQKTGKGLSEKTQKHYISFISVVMDYAIECHLISESPCKNIIPVKSEKKEEPVYSLEETKRILSIIEHKADIDYKVFFSILPFCGMRRGEVLGLEYKDINFNTGEVRIIRTSNYQNKETGVYTGTPKTKKGYRTIKLHPAIVELIKQLKLSQINQARKCGEYWNETDRLFITWDGQPMHPNTPYTWLRRFCEREEIEFKGLKAFRHFFATQAISNGVNIKSVSSMMGHSQTSTTLNIYAHAIKKADANGFQSVAASIMDN